MNEKNEYGETVEQFPEHMVMMVGTFLDNITKLKWTDERWELVLDRSGALEHHSGAHAAVAAYKLALEDVQHMALYGHAERCWVCKAKYATKSIDGGWYCDACDVETEPTLAKMVGMGVGRHLSPKEADAAVNYYLREHGYPTIGLGDTSPSDVNEWWETSPYRVEWLAKERA